MSASQQQSFSYLFGGEPITHPLTPEERLPPASRNTDSASSRRAESEVRRSGVMRGQRVIALSLVEKYPGRSSKELAELGTLDRYQLAKRLPELREMKLVRTTQEGHNDMRWWPEGGE